MNPGTSGECGAWTNLNWGQQVQTTTVNPDVLQGWGKRNATGSSAPASSTRSLPRVSVDVDYSRRWWGNFYVTQNRALTAADYDEVTLKAPHDPRLPGGGGYPVTLPRAQQPLGARRVRSVLHRATPTTARKRTTGTAST